MTEPPKIVSLQKLRDKAQPPALSDEALALSFAAGAVFANVFPFRTGSDTEALTALHLPIALWLAVGFAYVGGRWFAGGGRMDVGRFPGGVVRGRPP